MNILKSVFLFLMVLSRSLVESKQFEKREVDFLENDVRYFYEKLKSSERKIFSENNEDGVIEEIFELMSFENLSKYYVEIGTGPGKERNVKDALSG
jgi:hypothetical protein